MMWEYEVILALTNVDTDSLSVKLKIKITLFDWSFYLILLDSFFEFAVCNFWLLVFISVKLSLYTNSKQSYSKYINMFNERGRLKKT